MKTSQVLISSLSLLLSFSQMACSAKITSESPAADDPKPLTGGFDINTANGTWSTGCFVEKTGFASQTVLTISNASFDISVKYFKSNICQDPDIQFSYENKGLIVVQQESTSEAGSFEVDLRTDQGGGVTTIEKDLVRLENNELYLGDQSAPKNGVYPSKVDRLKVLTK